MATHSQLFRRLLLGTGIVVPAALYFTYPSPTRHAATSSTEPLSQTHFTPSTLSATQPSCPNTKLLTLTLAPSLIPKQSELGPVWSIMIKDDGIQVERPYTPLEGIDSEGRMKFWIKKYPRGEVGKWLHSKKAGEIVEIRGPQRTWDWKEGVWDDVVMISGGTGVTPFVQLFHSVIASEHSSPDTRFTLIHSSRTPDELPPTEVLGPLQAFAQEHPERLRVLLHVDSNDTNQLELTQGRIDQPSIEAAAGATSSWWNVLQRKTPLHERRTIFLVCGPEPMIRSIAGPFGRALSQGPVGGILGRMGAGEHQVYKLAA